MFNSKHEPFQFAVDAVCTNCCASMDPAFCSQENFVYVIHTLFLEDHAMAYVVSRCLFTAETLVHSRPVHVVIGMEEFALGPVCCPNTLVFPSRYNSAITACSLRHLLPAA